MADRLSSAVRRIDWIGIAFAVVLTVVILFPLIVVGTWAFTEVWRYPSIIPQKFGLRFWDATLVALRRLGRYRPPASRWRRRDRSSPRRSACRRPSPSRGSKFPGRNLLFFSFLAGHAFPKFGLLVAIATIFLSLHLIGTFWGVVLIQLVGTLLFMIWIPVAAFQGVDRRMEEAARDVGARPLRVFWSITLPQAAPTIAAAVLLTFVDTFYETEGAWLIGAPDDPHHAGRS